MEEEVRQAWSGKFVDFLIGFFLIGGLSGIALKLAAASAGPDRLVEVLVSAALAGLALSGYLYHKRKYMGIGLFSLLACQVFAASMLLGMLLSAGAGESGDLSSDPKYAHLMGHVFETTREMIVESIGTDSIMLDVPGEGGAPRVPDLPKDLPYKTFLGRIVLGVMPAGSRFQVVGVRRGWSTLSGGYTTYSLRMKTPKEYRNWPLSEIGLVSYDVYPKRFKKDLVREVIWSGRR